MKQFMFSTGTGLLPNSPSFNTPSNRINLLPNSLTTTGLKPDNIKMKVVPMKNQCSKNTK